MIFLDTGFLFAYVSENRPGSRSRERVLEEHRDGLSASRTTNQLSWRPSSSAARQRPRNPTRLAGKVGKALHAGVFGEVHHASAEEERGAFAFFERHRDEASMWMAEFPHHGESSGAAWQWEDFTHHFTARPGRDQ